MVNISSMNCLNNNIDDHSAVTSIALSKNAGHSLHVASLINDSVCKVSD